MDTTGSLSEYSREELQRVQDSIAYSVTRSMLSGIAAASVTELLGMFDDIEQEFARRSNELQDFIDSRAKRG